MTPRRERKKIETLFAHLKRILRLDGFAPGGPSSAQVEFRLALQFRTSESWQH